ncbi:3'-phosphoadenosine 5'-phosphosulfate sulfotransferase [Tilletia horrida]|nr:3'-phosphoadenosine 5'-phosphosulfate sulfotransferase [Tilletia horrida]
MSSSSNKPAASSMGPSASSSSSSSPWPTPSWLRSVDAVYELFERPELRRKYPRLSMLVWEGVRLCELVVREVGLEHCALSFNGGKDCTVLVHMLAAVLRRVHGHTQPPQETGPSSASSSSTSSAPPLIPIPSLYITCPSPFPTLESFVRASEHRYNLHLHTVRGPMKPALIEYFHGGGVRGVPAIGSEARDREEDGQGEGRGGEEGEEVGGVEGRVRKVKVVFIGTRRTDPNGAALGPRTPTDPGWPQVDRVHPILDWSYHDVWDFLRCPELGDAGYDASSSSSSSSGSGSGVSRDEVQVPESTEDGTCAGSRDGVPYCLLYDQGYTSLGSTYNTIPNPILRLDASEADDQSTPATAPTTAAAAAAAQTVGDGTATGRWKPAYMLPDGSSERAGRLRGQAQTDVVKDCTAHDPAAASAASKNGA